MQYRNAHLIQCRKANTQRGEKREERGENNATAPTKASKTVQHPVQFGAVHGVFKRRLGSGPNRIEVPERTVCLSCARIGYVLNAPRSESNAQQHLTPPFLWVSL